VFALLKVSGTRHSKRYRWTGPEKSKHVVYALYEETGRSVTLEVDIEDCEDKDKDKDKNNKTSGKDVNTLSLGTEVTDFMVGDGVSIGIKGPVYTTYGSFTVWPVPTSASLYALYFNSAGIEAFDWGDLEISKESDATRPQAELLSFSNSENASLQYAPLGNAVNFEIVGKLTGKFEDGRSPSVLALKGPGETVYKRTIKSYTYTDPLTGKEVKGYKPSDEGIKVGPNEVYCVEWVSGVVIKGTGKVVAKYSCPARVYNFKMDALAALPFWTKWNCQVSVGYQVNDLIFGPLSGNGTFSTPNPFEMLKAMWNKEYDRRFKVLKDAKYDTELWMGKK